MMKVLWDTVNDGTKTQVRILAVQSTEEQNFHLQCITTCVTPSHPYQPQKSSTQILIMLNGMVIQLSPRNTSQQHHWMMKSGLQIQFWINHCASKRELMSQASSFPTPVFTAPQPSGYLPQSTPQGTTVLNYKLMNFSDHLIRPSWHNDDNKWQCHSWSCGYFWMPG